MNDNKEWNDFVSASKWGDILQFWQWGEVKRSEGWEPFTIGGEWAGIGSLCLVKKAPYLGNVLYVPHGPIFHSVEKLESSVESWLGRVVEFAKEKNCFVIEIEPKVGISLSENPDSALSHFTDSRIVDVLKKAGFSTTKKNVQPKYKLLYNLEKSDDELMSLMSKSTRYNIRYAEKKGVEVKEYLPDDPQIENKLKEFYELLKVTQKRTGGYPIRPFSSFKRLFELFKDTENISLFESSFSGDLIAMNISQRTKNWASSFYAGSNRLHSKVKAPYLLRWKSIQRAKEFGSKVYDFWGIIPDSKQHKGYSDHKLSFGGERIDHVGIMQMPLDSTKTVIFNKLVPLRTSLAGLKRKIL